jgi:probable LLM family oxidoreductase
MSIEFGVDTFGDVSVGDDGQPLPQPEVLRNVIEEGVLAEKVELDFIGVGEHHREDFAVSAPEVVLAAIAARTERIHVGSAVTVLSSDDPVRVYERFATVDGISNGRAEVILGRGSFTESFPLFGFPLEKYEELFEDKLQLFAELVKGGPVTWQGSTRAALTDQLVHPATAAPLKTWVGVGGSPESVVRAAHYGFPLVLAIIGGDPRRFAPYADLYRRALTQFGRDELPIAVHSPGYIAETDAQARDEYWPHHLAMTSRIGRERGWSPQTREGYEAEVDSGALNVGSPETVARKIADTIQALGLSRFDMKYSSGTLPHVNMMRSIELYGTEVVPRVRELLAQ